MPQSKLRLLLPLVAVFCIGSSVLAQEDAYGLCSIHFILSYFSFLIVYFFFKAFKHHEFMRWFFFVISTKTYRLSRNSLFEVRILVRFVEQQFLESKSNCNFFIENIYHNFITASAKLFIEHEASSVRVFIWNYIVYEWFTLSCTISSLLAQLNNRLNLSQM